MIIIIIIIVIDNEVSEDESDISLDECQSPWMEFTMATELKWEHESSCDSTEVCPQNSAIWLWEGKRGGSSVYN